MKQWFSKLLLLALTIVLAACGYPGPPKPPSLNLPQPPKDLRAIRKGNTVYLTWTAPTETTDGLTVRHFGSTRVCRSTRPNLNDCPKSIAEVPVTTQSKSPVPNQQTYTDSLASSLLGNDSSAQISYAVSVLNHRGRSAGISNLVAVPALIAPPAPPDFRAELSAAGVTLRWTPIPHSAEPSDLRQAYRIYRRDVDSTADTIVGESPLNASQLTDQTFEWEKTYFYRAAVVTFISLPGKSEEQFEGDDTSPVKVFAHDIFPPSVPSGLQAAFSGVGQQPFVDLIWTPDSEPDLAGYNIYRRDNGSEPTKINTQEVKTPSFRDSSVTSGHTYVYSVSAADVRGNESAGSNEASESVP